VIFDNHGYISELDRVHFEITIDFYFYFSPVENFPFFDKEIGKILDFFSSVNSSKFWLNLIFLKGEKKNTDHIYQT
jgi:hypothetical protein